MYMDNCHYIKQLRRSGGGVATSVVICAVSLVVLAAVIIVLLRTFEARSADDIRRAETISAYGVQEALLSGLCGEWTDFVDRPYPSDADGVSGLYSVSITREIRNDTLHIKTVSVGTAGSVSRTQEDERSIPITLFEELCGNKTPGELEASDGEAGETDGGAER